MKTDHEIFDFLYLIFVSFLYDGRSNFPRWWIDLNMHIFVNDLPPSWHRRLILTVTESYCCSQSNKMTSRAINNFQFSWWIWILANLLGYLRVINAGQFSFWKISSIWQLFAGWTEGPREGVSSEGKLINSTSYVRWNSSREWIKLWSIVTRLSNNRLSRWTLASSIA